MMVIWMMDSMHMLCMQQILKVEYKDLEMVIWMDALAVMYVCM